MPNKRILHYEILEKIGRGGMGVVYKAEDQKLKRLVALKFLSVDLVGNHAERERFLIEARAAASLNHPNIATIYDIGESESDLFFAMELIEGQTLSQRISSGPLDQPVALEIALQIARGLQAAHDRGIVHRDIKSANIMVSQDGRVKIMDFGLAKLRDGTRITRVGATMGTATYMSPEQAHGEDVDHRSDIWSFGVVLYELLTGRPPFRSEYESAVVYSILNEEPLPLSHFRSDIKSWWQPVVSKALTKDRSLRYQHMRELIAELDQLQTSSTREFSLSQARAGTATFLFSDIEGSTRMLQQIGDAYAGILSRQRSILRTAFTDHGGREIDMAGDGFFVAFDRARQAVAAAVAAQRALAQEEWPAGVNVRVRMGLHTGEPTSTSTGYVGLDVHRTARICAAGHGGQILLSQATWALVSNDLPEDVRVKDLGTFRLKDLDKPEQIYQLVVNGLPPDFPPLHTQSAVIHNLPTLPTEILGREQEAGGLRQLLLQEGIRLVTLTGPGGTGKTSLAIHVASSLVSSFNDGVMFVSLSPITDPNLVAPTIGHALGITEKTSRPAVESLKQYLAHKNQLLILDNFEQVVDAAPVVGELLAACPRIKILVTSRFVLQLRGEQEFSVPPLSLPDLRHLPAAEMLSRFGAIQLFVQRATAVKPDFVVNDQNAAAVAEICARLDGLPLAIELAAARIKLFSPQAILTRLGSRLELLKGGARDLPSRHQTLRSAIAWSYDLLTSEEQTLFRRIAVFVGGCSFEAIGIVCNAGGDLEMDILDGVSALANKSLLRQEEHHGEPRFVMLETIREFAHEKLTESPDRESLRRSHALYCLMVAEHAEPMLTGPEQGRWLDRLEIEYDNMRAALQWAEETGNQEAGLKLSGALWRYWIVRGNLVEGADWMKRLLAMPVATTRPRIRAKVLNATGTILHELSRYGESRPMLEESLRIYRELGDSMGAATVLNNLGWVAVLLGEVDNAREFSEEGQVLHRELGNKRGVALALNNLGWLKTFQGEHEEACTLHQQNLEIRRELGDTRGVAFANINLAWSLVKMGAHDRAAMLLQEAVRLLRALGDKQIMAFSYSVQAQLLHAQGDYQKAVALLSEGMGFMRDIGNQWGVAFEDGILGHIEYDLGNLDEAERKIRGSLEEFRSEGTPWGMGVALNHLGWIALDRKNAGLARNQFLESLEIRSRVMDMQGIAECFESLSEVLHTDNPERAGVLIGAAESIRNSIKSPLVLCERKRVEPVRSIIRELVGDNPINAGKAMSLKEAVALAMETA